MILNQSSITIAPQTLSPPSTPNSQPLTNTTSNPQIRFKKQIMDLNNNNICVKGSERNSSTLVFNLPQNRRERDAARHKVHGGGGDKPLLNTTEEVAEEPCWTCGLQVLCWLKSKLGTPLESSIGTLPLTPSSSYVATSLKNFYTCQNLVGYLSNTPMRHIGQVGT